jgi:type III secretory pathway component EscU
MSLTNTNVLFILSQDETIINAVKSSCLVNIFRNIIFVEEEMYMNELVKSVIQPVGYGGSIISVEKIKTFIEQIKVKENLKDMIPENYYVMTIESLIDIIGEEKKETCELVLVNLYHKENIYH